MEYLFDRWMFGWDYLLKLKVHFNKNWLVKKKRLRILPKLIWLNLLIILIYSWNEKNFLSINRTKRNDDFKKGSTVLHKLLELLILIFQLKKKINKFNFYSCFVRGVDIKLENILFYLSKKYACNAFY